MEISWWKKEALERSRKTLDGEDGAAEYSKRIRLSANKSPSQAESRSLGPGLPECMEMDGQLAKVASAKIGDVYGTVIDEIFQCLDLFKLLKLRRVCKDWHAAISRDAAPFLRHVVIAIDDKYNTPTRTRCCKCTKVELKFWQFAKQATTLLVFEGQGCRGTHPTWWNWGRGSRIANIWSAYEDEVKIDQRRILIDKVTYANTEVDSEDLRHTMVTRSGFQTVLYKSGLSLKVYELNFPNGKLNFRDPSITFQRQFEVEVIGRDSFRMLDADMAQSKQRIVWLVDDDYHNQHDFKDAFFPNPAAEYFGLRHFKPVTEEKIANWTNEHLYVDDDSILRFLEQMLQRFNPGNTAALERYKNRDYRGFVALCHPIIPFLERLCIGTIYFDFP